MIVGITGSIGSGKSTVCEYLSSLGFYVLDADRISRELMMINQKGYLQTLDLFQESILLENGEIDRAELAKKIFYDKEAKSKLEAILHPLILEELKRLTKEFTDKCSGTSCFVFWEVPLLFETNYHVHCDLSVCVVAEKKLLIDRVKLRSNLNTEEVEQRLLNQMLVEDKMKLADYVIHNQGSLNDLYEQIDQLVALLQIRCWANE